jgi:20S proteasome subunit beta 3
MIFPSLSTAKTSFLAILLVFYKTRQIRAQTDPTTYNGGSCLAMAGHNCVALAVDKRFGSGLSLVNVQARSVLMPSARILVGFTGLQGDVLTLQQELAVLVDDKYSRSLGMGGKQTISAKSMATLTSHVMYGRRNAPYYVEPMVVGLATDDDDADDADSRTATSYRPFLCSMDCIGAQSSSEAFVCSGVAAKSLYGTAEALWRPDLSADDLVKVCAEAFTSALERDCLSGYGAMIYVITGDGITEHDLASRND